ncbi:MAG TPA: hypothetical protein VMX13_10460 [Sedimentisphaerales bacterium]|nr:hypothetical protein [Sedimentisphaerales bacterium]
MPDNLRLTKRQSAVLDDMFAGELDEQAVLEKHNVSQKTFNRWLGEDAFMAELNRRLQWLNLQTELIITRYKTLAAARLVQLTESDKEETARKACLDIINLPNRSDIPPKQPSNEPKVSTPPEYHELSPETCSRLLAVLAEEKKETGR